MLPAVVVPLATPVAEMVFIEEEIKRTSEFNTVVIWLPVERIANITAIASDENIAVRTCTQGSRECLHGHLF